MLSVSSSWGEQAELLLPSPGSAGETQTGHQLFTERSVSQTLKKAPQEVTPSPLLVKKCLGDSQIAGLTFSLPFVESGVGLDNPHGSLPDQDIIICFN